MVRLLCEARSTPTSTNLGWLVAVQSWRGSKSLNSAVPMKNDPQFWFDFCVYCWIAFVVYWFVSALKRKETKRKESWQERMRHSLPLLVAYMLTFAPVAHYGLLGARVVPASELVGMTGAMMTAAGVGLAIWARWHLGTNWSSTVSIRADHELIHTGPYRTIRHPIYTGMLLAFAGTALALGEVRGAIAFVIVLIAFYFKARKEESFLTQEFGERFAERARQTGMFLPRLS
jgi:protein-S-isoprenylcysteine O-methyltransferase Ste14